MRHVTATVPVMNWWEGLWGWAITTALAAIAAVGVVVEFIQRRRERPFGFPAFSVVGNVHRDGEFHTLVAIQNAGTARVHIRGIWPRGRNDPALVFPDGQYRIPVSLGPGESRDLLMKGTHDGRWFVIMWEVAGATWTRATWTPLESSGPLFDEWMRQVEEFTAAYRRLPWRRPRPPLWSRGLGPGGGTCRVDISPKLSDDDRDARYRAIGDGAGQGPQA